MQEMVNVYFYGKKYTVPADLTIMTAMEYAGYKLVRGCGCRHGFCGACATIYRIKGQNELKTCLACQTQVQEGMYVTRCPAGISHPMVGLLARRLTGKYIAPESEHLEKRVDEIRHGEYDQLIEQIMETPIDQMKELYNNRDIEK